MAETGQAAHSLPAQADGFAPSVHSATFKAANPDKPTQPRSFERQAIENADIIAKELDIDTSAQTRQPEPAPAPVQEPRAQDDDFEFAPGKKLSKKELQTRLREHEDLKKRKTDMERAANAKMQQAAEQRKQHETDLARYRQIEQRLQQVMQSGDPERILQEFGYDPAVVRQQIIQKEIADSQKTPEQRQIDKLNQELQQRRQQEQRFEQQRQEQVKRQQHQQQEQVTAQYAARLSDAFTKTAEAKGLAKNAATIQRMSLAMEAANSQGIDPTFDQLGDYVAKEFRAEFSQWLDSVPEERILREIPEPILKKIQKALLKRMNAPSANQQEARRQSPSRRPEKPLSAAEYNNFISKLRGGQ